MLTELQIRNFAIIEEQAVEFGRGLNVITGETGSGKSIILGALEFILGARTKAHAVRAGAENLEVEAHFDLRELTPQIRANLPEIAQADELAILRSLNNSGRSRVTINGRLGTVALLEEIASKLINICGQNQHIKLLESEYQLDLLDSYAKNKDLRDRFARLFAESSEAARVLKQARADSERSIMRRAELEFVVEELGKIEPRAGMRAGLEAEVRKLSNGEKIRTALAQINSELSDDAGAMLALKSASRQLHELVKLDQSIGALSARFDGALEDLLGCEADLVRHARQVVLDDQELEALRERLAEIARVERKYRIDDAGLEKLLNSARLELSQLSDPQHLEKLIAHAQSTREAALACSSELSISRGTAARALARDVQSELAELAMAGVRLKVEITPQEMSANGSDRVEFTIATNKGEPFKPLKLIASGGELARIMLVLKKVLRERSGVNVVVFDEVDTGVSGAVARAVGMKLHVLSEQSQVICVTHLPQVASLADVHLLVGKEVGKRTVSRVRILNQNERVDEIARMLAGSEVTAAAKASARELLGGIA